VCSSRCVAPRSLASKNNIARIIPHRARTRLPITSLSYDDSAGALYCILRSKIGRDRSVASLPIVCLLISLSLSRDTSALMARIVSQIWGNFGDDYRVNCAFSCILSQERCSRRRNELSKEGREVTKKRKTQAELHNCTTAALGPLYAVESLEMRSVWQTRMTRLTKHSEARYISSPQDTSRYLPSAWDTGQRDPDERWSRTVSAPWILRRCSALWPHRSCRNYQTRLLRGD